MIVNQENDLKLIEKLIELKESIDSKVKECLNDNQSIKVMINTAFEDFILIKVNQLSELFSKFLDLKLTKSGLSIKDESIIVTEIDRALSIFKFFTAKDVFETFFT